jgi:hypothetical protein
MDDAESQEFVYYLVFLLRMSMFAMSKLIDFFRPNLVLPGQRCVGLTMTSVKKLEHIIMDFIND